MRFVWVIGFIAWGLLAAGCSARSDPTPTKTAKTTEGITARLVIDRYAEHAYQTYVKAVVGAIQLQKTVDAFLAEPNESTLESAKQAWLASRGPYSRTEAFRFYEGPIDGPAAGSPGSPGKGYEEGPEGRINAWPLNEAYIDYVQGNPKAGIINNGLVPITELELKHRNASQDEADVTTGYHAIEFLLWGQDLDPEGAGHRPAKDFEGSSPAAQRRREYLRVAMALLVKDLQYVVDQWKPGENNYRAVFVRMDEKDALGNIMTGLATMSGFELASERMGVPLDSGSQQDEQSCFSDNTHNDYIDNVAGIVETHTASGLDKLIASVDPDAARKLTATLDQTLAELRAIKPPIDRILASQRGTEGRKQLEHAAALLTEVSRLFIDAGAKMGCRVTISSE